MLKKQPADDLFEKSSMSFGEHLEELRKSLGKAFLWLGVGTIVGLVFAEQIVLFIEQPLTSAIRDFYISQAKDQFKEANGEEPSGELAEWIAFNGIMPERVFVDPSSLTETEPNVGMHAALVVPSPPQANSESSSDERTTSPSAAEPTPVGESSSQAVEPAGRPNPWRDIDLKKLARLQPFLLWRPIPNKMVTLTPIEGFMIWLKAGLVAGVVFGSPGIFFHIWQFLAAGLYPHERRYVYWYLPLSLMLFISGVSLAFFVIFRLVLGFLMTYTAGMNVEFMPRLNDYMSFALLLPLGFGIAFQLPILMLGLHRFGLVSVETFMAQWRIAVLAIAFLSMVLTPADIYSMLGLFVPLVGLYFFGIFLCRYMPRGAGLGSAGIDPQG
jgi:sec-independent protein translocase protein TatC